MQDPRFCPLVLHRLPNLGAATYLYLIEHFGSAQRVLQQPLADLELLLKPATLAAIAGFQQNPSASAVGQRAEADLAWLDAQADAQLLMLEDANYPALLRQIAKPPPLLFARGDITCIDLPQIAIVGSRNPTAGGVENARRFAQYLTANGFTITSGLALGIDAAAHEGALLAQGKTLAVMATGIDKIYPAGHTDLAQRIIAGGGLLLSEFPLGTSAQASHFPQRNRIISGLSWGVLVVEAAVQSGSLITAKAATQQNREVFAIPGSIHNPLARGCHQLLRQGATLVEKGQDIVDQLSGMLQYQRDMLLQVNSRQDEQRYAEIISNEFGKMATQSPKDSDSLSPADQKLLAAMGYDPITIDELIERTQSPVGSLMAQLVGLELKGFVRVAGAEYQRV